MTETSYRAINHESEALPGEQVVYEIPASFFIPKFDQVLSAAIDGIQRWLDATAQQNGYDGVVSCASYAASTVPQFKADALAIVAWRDAVWQSAYAWKDSLGGQLPANPPTIEQIIAQLPKPSTYGWTVHGEGANNELPEQS